MNERKLRGVGLIWDKVRLTRSEVRLTKYVCVRLTKCVCVCVCVFFMRVCVCVFVIRLCVCV